MVTYLDLEQREGRINRFDGLSIRQNIAADRSLDDFLPCLVAANANGRPNLWDRIFATVASDTGTEQRFKHGLYPHWSYQPRCLEESDSALIRRHLLFYDQSDDVRRYHGLKEALSLYRLVLGQPRQKDLLDVVRSRAPPGGESQASHPLSRYMVNLSPFEKGHARRAAQDEARQIVEDPRRVHQIIKQARSMLGSDHAEPLGSLQADVERLITVISANDKTALAQEQRIDAIAALIYPINPYDDIYDIYGEWGLRDDAKVIRDAISRVGIVGLS